MANLTEQISTVNSFLRTLLAAALLAGVGLVGWLSYRYYQDQMATGEQLQEARQQLDDAREQLERKDAALRAQAEEIGHLQADVDRLSTSLRLLKVNYRVAQLSVVDQRHDDKLNDLVTTVEFVELGEDGQPLEEAQQYRIQGDLVYVDSWIVKFADKYIENADIDRAASLVLFRRLFGSKQNPDSGFPLEKEGERPTGYSRTGEPTQLEQQIWKDFWSIANDPARAQELGIRAAHGDAVSMKLQKGRRYLILLRASDGLSFVSEKELEPLRNGPTG